MRGHRTPPPPPGSERRQHPRYEIFAQVEISGNEATLVLPVRNISVGGLYVALDRDASPGDGSDGAPGFSPDESVTVFLDAGVDGEGRPLHVTRDASIVRIDRGDKPGVALRWTSMDPELVGRFDKVLDFLRRRGVPDAA